MTRRYDRPMDIRLARPGDAEAVRAIYNVEVSGSTVTFDIEPRSHAQQVAWIERHQGVHPAMVAVDAAGGGRFRVAVAFP